MRLYHGSLERIVTPRIMPREFYRPLDFGTGFYTTYEGGFYTESEAIEKMKAYRLADQYLFHTERSLSALRYMTCLEVGS